MLVLHRNEEKKDVFLYTFGVSFGAKCIALREFPKDKVFGFGGIYSNFLVLLYTYSNTFRLNELINFHSSCFHEMTVEEDLNKLMFPVCFKSYIFLR